MKLVGKTMYLREFLEIQNGFAFDSKFFDFNNGVPLIRIRDLKCEEKTEIRYNGPYDNKYLVQAGDLLIGMDGEFECHEWRGEPSLLNQRVCRLEKFDASVEPHYLLYGINSYLKNIERTTSYTTVKHISSRQILDIKMPIPSLPEQQRIVAILDQAFEGIAKAKANAEQNLKNAREVLENHLQTVFCQSNKKENLRLGEAVQEIATGPFGSMLHKSDYQYGGIPLVNPINIIKNTIVPDHKKSLSNNIASKLSRYKLRYGDIVIARRGEIGRCAVVSKAQSGWVCGTGCFIIRPSEHINSIYLASLLRSRTYCSQLERVAGRATMPSISNSDLASLVIWLPPLKEQHRIVRLVQSLQAETQRLESIYQRKIAALDELKKSLLHKAFSGEL